MASQLERKAAVSGEISGQHPLTTKGQMTLQQSQHDIQVDVLHFNFALVQDATKARQRGERVCPDSMGNIQFERETEVKDKKVAAITLSLASTLLSTVFRRVRDLE